MRVAIGLQLEAVAHVEFVGARVVERVYGDELAAGGPVAGEGSFHEVLFFVCRREDDGVVCQCEKGNDFPLLNSIAENGVFSSIFAQYHLGDAFCVLLLLGVRPLFFCGQVAAHEAR